MHQLPSGGLHHAMRLRAIDSTAYPEMNQLNLHLRSAVIFLKSPLLVKTVDPIVLCCTFSILNPYQLISYETAKLAIGISAFEQFLPSFQTFDFLYQGPPCPLRNDVFASNQIQGVRAQVMHKRGRKQP